MIFLKIHETEHGAIIAMCDEKLIGNIYKDKKTETILDLKKYAEFYKGELLETKTAIDVIKNISIYSGNIVGEESVSVIIKAGLADGSEIKKIDKIPSLHIYNIL